MSNDNSIYNFFRNHLFYDQDSNPVHYDGNINIVYYNDNSYLFIEQLKLNNTPFYITYDNDNKKVVVYALNSL